MVIVAWTVNTIGEVCYTLREEGTENYVKELYAITKARLDQQKASHKIQAYTLEVTV